MSAVLVRWSPESMVEVKALAMASEKKYARLCAHPDVDDRMHEMLIAIHRDARVRSHVHNYDESLTLLEGSALIVTPEGSIMMDRDNFFARIPAGCEHRPVAVSDWFVFIECAPGPWRKENTEWLEH
jgi:cupin fold WbuC family metalloprotein